MENLIGQSFNSWTVIGAAERKKVGGPRRWLCRCQCGSEKPCVEIDLKRGHTKSCGCYQKAQVSVARKTHGRSKTPEYNSWANVVQRCLNTRHPRYADYGGRGITVCQRWRESFEAFFADMGPKPSPKHSIERKDNSGNYEPGNCHWAGPVEQTNNARRNRVLTHDGRTMTVAQWTKELGFGASIIGLRLAKGWTVAEALTVPVSRSNKIASIRHCSGA